MEKMHGLELSKLKKGKTVFVTVGTTQFNDLIFEVMNPAFLQMLVAFNFDHLILQIGTENKYEPDCKNLYGLRSIKYFNLCKSIEKYIKSADLVISHAGVGTVMEVLENHKFLIAVVNEQLMDNHQVELTDQLSKEGYLFVCTCKDLYETVKVKKFIDLKPFTDIKSMKIANYINKTMGFN